MTFRLTFARLAPLALATAVLCVLPATAGNATTIFSTQNLFETNDHPVTFERDGAGWGVQFTNDPAHADTFRGFAAISTTPGHWSAVETGLLIGAPGASCSLSVAVNAAGGTDTVNVEVIDPDTWSYVALKTTTVSGTGYHLITMNFRASGNEEAVFRVSLTDPVRFLLPTPPAPVAYVDTLKSQCVQPSA